MKKLYKLLYIFVISSVCGYFIELIWTLARKGVFINHSAVVIGPFNFAYGICAWDYSNMFLNINGRICLLFSIFWGILGILWIKLLYPKIENLLNKIKPKIYKIVIISLTIFLLFDILLTISAVNRAHDADSGIPANNSYERFLDNTFNSKYLKNMFNNNWE